jgi:uncharacterized protein
MSTVILRRHDEQIVARDVQMATTFTARLRGLLGRSGLAPSQGLLLSPCRDVHTCGMRFPIDIVFLDRDMTVVRHMDAVPPWRFHFGGRRCHHVLELAAGVRSRVQLRVGDALSARGECSDG